MPFTYRYECKGIQNWILRSDKLTDICGASHIVEQFGSTARSLAGDHTAADVIVATAGVGLVEFRTDAALRAFASEWPMRVAAMAPGLRVVQAWTEGTGSDAQKKVIDLVAAARNVASPTLPEAAPMARRANRTGEPAVTGGTDLDGDGEWQDHTTSVVRAKGAVDSLRDRFGIPEELRLNNDLQAWPEGYLAVVHIDGNSVGAALRKLPPAALRGFSAELLTATQKACKEASKAALSHWRLRHDNNDAPIRPLVLGGDDVTVLLHASMALKFVQAYVAGFDALSPKDADGRSLTASAGIAFVKRGFPFAQAHHLAEELCRGAKRANDTDAPKSRVLFHRVTTSSLRTWESIRETELAEVLVGGPYTAEGITAIHHLCRVMSMYKLARGSLRQWVDVVRDDALKGERKSRTFSASEKRWQRILQTLDANAPGSSKRLFDAMGDGARTGRRPNDTTIVFDALTLLGVDAWESA